MMNLNDCIKNILYYIGADLDHVYRVEMQATATPKGHSTVTVFKYAVNSEGEKYLNSSGDGAEVLQPEQYEISNRRRGKHEGPPTFIEVTAMGDSCRRFIEGL